MHRLFVFGLGYVGRRLAAHLRDEGWHVAGTRRNAADGAIAFDDAEAVARELAAAQYVLSTVPPDADGGDPVLTGHAAAIARCGWRGYLSSTGVYGDAAGAWVDESAPLGTGRRGARAAADAAWLDAGAHVFRLPGIYGPGRSPLDRVARGEAHRTQGEHVFGRIHVDDIVAGVVAGFTGPAGAYNLADDRPTSQNAVVARAAAMLGVAPPRFVAVEALSPAAQGFHAEQRRVATGKAKRVLGWTPRYADYRAGLRAVSATTSPAAASAAPKPASGDQR